MLGCVNANLPIEAVPGHRVIPGLHVDDLDRHLPAQHLVDTRPRMAHTTQTQGPGRPGAQDWTVTDRTGNTDRWKQACLRNLNSLDSSQYVKVVERRDFYKWFYEHTAGLGYTTRWALAARLVADGAHQIADMDVDHDIADDALEMTSVELQGMMREGNQVIFDNVLPKLKALLDGGKLTGRAALAWDMRVLSEEQNLVQPLYMRVSQKTRDELDYIARKKRFAGLGAWISGRDKVAQGPFNNAGTVPAFDQPNLSNPEDRWRYGMNLGNKFAPSGTGFDPSREKMPTPQSGYTDGTELAKVDARAHLHELDAWLNPNRLSRVQGTPGSDIGAIVRGLSEFEKNLVLSNRSPDGWEYSTQFAQFTFVPEATVRLALPSDPTKATEVASFVKRFNDERNRVETSTPDIGFGAGF